MAHIELDIIEQEDCCICLNKIEENIVNCLQCNSKICIECFEKIDKKIKIINNELNTSYNCPICRFEMNIELIDINNIKKYNLIDYIKKYIINLNNNLLQSELNNTLLFNKNQYLLYYTQNFYNIIKLLYIIDKGIFFVIGMTIYFFK